jgi:transcriptional regulator with XRE-family HTH domain
MPNELAEELRRVRGIRNVSLRDVEKATDISNAYLSQLERGTAKNPSPHILYKLSSYYKIPYESLMEVAGYMQNKSTTSKKRPSAIQAALMSADLDDEETARVADFIEFIRTQRRKGSK